MLLVLIFKVLLTSWKRKYSIPLDHLSGDLNVISILSLQAHLQMHLALFSFLQYLCTPKGSNLLS